MRRVLVGQLRAAGCRGGSGCSRHRLFSLPATNCTSSSGHGPACYSRERVCSAATSSQAADRLAHGAEDAAGHPPATALTFEYTAVAVRIKQPRNSRRADRLRRPGTGRSRQHARSSDGTSDGVAGKGYYSAESFKGDLAILAAVEGHTQHARPSQGPGAHPTQHSASSSLAANHHPCPPSGLVVATGATAASAPLLPPFDLSPGVSLPRTETAAAAAAVLSEQQGLAGAQPQVGLLQVSELVRGWERQFSGSASSSNARASSSTSSTSSTSNASGSSGNSSSSLEDRSSTCAPASALTTAAAALESARAAAHQAQHSQQAQPSDPHGRSPGQGGHFVSLPASDLLSLARSSAAAAVATVAHQQQQQQQSSVATGAHWQQQQQQPQDEDLSSNQRDKLQPFQAAGGRSSWTAGPLWIEGAVAHAPKPARAPKTAPALKTARSSSAQPVRVAAAEETDHSGARVHAVEATEGGGEAWRQAQQQGQGRGAGQGQGHEGGGEAQRQAQPQGRGRGQGLGQARIAQQRREVAHAQTRGEAQAEGQAQGHSVCGQPRRGRRRQGDHLEAGVAEKLAFLSAALGFDVGTASALVSRERALLELDEWQVVHQVQQLLAVATFISKATAGRVKPTPALKHSGRRASGRQPSPSPASAPRSPSPASASTPFPSPVPPPSPTPAPFAPDPAHLPRVASWVQHHPQLLLSPADAPAVVAALLQLTGGDAPRVARALQACPVLLVEPNLRGKPTRGRDVGDLGGGEGGEGDGGMLCARGDVGEGQGYEGGEVEGSSFAARAAGGVGNSSDSVGGNSCNSCNNASNNAGNSCNNASNNAGNSCNTLDSSRRYLAMFRSAVSSLETLLGLTPEQALELAFSEPSILRLSPGSLATVVGALSKPLRLTSTQLRDLVLYSPELLCEGPGPLMAVSRHFADLMQRSASWSKQLPALKDHPRNLSVALSFNTARYDRLRYLVTTRRDLGISFKAALSLPQQDFEEMYPGYKRWWAAKGR